MGGGGVIVMSGGAMDVRWCGPDDLEEMELASTMWPMLEKLFERSYANKYKQD